MRVDLSGADPAALLDLAYHNQAPDNGQGCKFEIGWGPTYEEQTRRCYWDYVRVFAPPGSTLTGASAHSLAPESTWNGQGYSGAATTEPAPRSGELCRSAMSLSS